ncbi:MAG: hypothetical protein AB1505_23685 [Candidatus Latescibacterota bacterium]
MGFIAVLGMLVPTGMLRTFVTSSSGQVLPERALGLGWMAAGLAAMAALMGTATRAPADDCFGIALGSTAWICETSCKTVNCPPGRYWQSQWHHGWDHVCVKYTEQCNDACC